MKQKNRTMLIELWPNAWYLVIERSDKPAGMTIGDGAGARKDFQTWMVWATCVGPFPKIVDAYHQVRHYHPYITNFAPFTYERPKFDSFMPITRHVVLALVANANDPIELASPIEPDGFDALDQVIQCECGNKIPLADMDEEHGVTVVWCENCRRSVDVGSVIEANAMAYGGS